MHFLTVADLHPRRRVFSFCLDRCSFPPQHTRAQLSSKQTTALPLKISEDESRYELLVISKEMMTDKIVRNVCLSSKAVTECSSEPFSNNRQSICPRLWCTILRVVLKHKDDRCISVLVCYFHVRQKSGKNIPSYPLLRTRMY